METVKITAVSKRGAPIVSVHVNLDETLDTVLNIISDKLTKSSSRRALLDQWIVGGRMIKITSEV